MTCLLFTHRRIYTDTLHINEAGEEFHSLNKIKVVKAKIPISWTPLEDQPLSEDSNPPAFTDMIHGYTCSGSNVVTNRFIEILGNELRSVVSAYDPHAKDSPAELVEIAIANNLTASLSNLFLLYKFVSKAGFVNSANMATVILIGEKACYAVEFDQRRPELGRLSRDNPTSYGTGAPYASKALFLTKDPILAMYNAMWHDSDQTGGMIDVWEMPTVEMPELRRAGACNRRTLLEIRDILVAPINPDDPLRPDLISNEIFSAKLETVAEISEQVGYDRGAGKLEDPQNRAAKAARAKGATQRLLKKHKDMLDKKPSTSSKKASKTIPKPRKPK